LGGEPAGPLLAREPAKACNIKVSAYAQLNTSLLEALTYPAVEELLTRQKYSGQIDV
jgi:hypothetical protein